MQEKRKGPSVGAGVVAIKQLYENNVAMRALKRAGRNKNLKGHIFEQLTVDKINMKPHSILKGEKAVLTKSTTAIRDDVLVKQGKKIAKRIQLKDTPKGIKDTVTRVANKQYAGTNLVGTKETAKAYANEIAKKEAKGVKITQKMTTNGISSGQTELIAAKTFGGNVVKQSEAIIGQASKTGVKAAALSAAVGVTANAKRVVNKEITVKKALNDVVKDSAVNATASAVGDAAATVVTIAVASTPAAPAAVAAGTVVGVGATIATDNVIRNADFSKMAKNVGDLRRKTHYKIRNRHRRHKQPVIV